MSDSVPGPDDVLAAAQRLDKSSAHDYAISSPYSFPRDARLVARAFLAQREMAKAMGPRENPLHPMFRGHNCSRCGDGKKPCKQGNPSQCEFPHARND